MCIRDSHESVGAPETTHSRVYDPFKREPMFANADNTCAWELNALTHHFHPTIRKYATSILTDENKGVLQYPGNPLLDFSLANVLDRISMKKPKLKKTTGFTKLAQKNKIRMSKLEGPLTLKAMMNSNRGEIRPDEQFFYKYFKEKQSRKELEETKMKQKRRRGIDDEMEEDFGGYDDEGPRDKEITEEEEIDAFADELFEKQLQGDVDEDDDEEIDYDYSDDDEDGGFGGDEGFGDEEDDDDYYDDEEDDDGRRGKKKGKGEGTALGTSFVDAEEFQSMLENSGKNKFGRYDNDDDEDIEADIFGDDDDGFESGGGKGGKRGGGGEGGKGKKGKGGFAKKQAKITSGKQAKSGMQNKIRNNIKLSLIHI
eukprot:TRINITY_DN11986_c0_g2_i2.p1 TRINITY_DN11986_c0_g2~~TRINITY_DN11986_c0_g2_i2.p1  ORF type:complete len:390 (-),score=152.26 TRINITY_DN11986_c0_g2_i2:61-1170(-)